MKEISTQPIHVGRDVHRKAKIASAKRGLSMRIFAEQALLLFINSQPKGAPRPRG